MRTECLHRNDIHPFPERGFSGIMNENRKEQIIQIQHNMANNPSWQETDQLAIYKRDRGVELETIEKHPQIAVGLLLS